MLLQLWCHAITLIAESALEGVARVRSRCSAIGRNAMSSDLQANYSCIFGVVSARLEEAAHSCTQVSSLPEGMYPSQRHGSVTIASGP